MLNGTTPENQHKNRGPKTTIGAGNRHAVFHFAAHNGHLEIVNSGFQITLFWM